MRASRWTPKHAAIHCPSDQVHGYDPWVGTPGDRGGEELSAGGRGQTGEGGEPGGAFDATLPGLGDIAGGGMPALAVGLDRTLLRGAGAADGGAVASPVTTQARPIGGDELVVAEERLAPARPGGADDGGPGPALDVTRVGSVRVGAPGRYPRSPDGSIEETRAPVDTLIRGGSHDPTAIGLGVGGATPPARGDDTPGDTLRGRPVDPRIEATRVSAHIVAAVAEGRRAGEREAGELPRGTLIDRFLIVDRLGTGAMGVVYCAFDPELDRKVALKLLQPTLLSGSALAGQDARARLLREAQALAKLSHPNVVAIHDVGTHLGDVWIAMELIEGGTFTRWMEEHTEDRDAAIEVLCAAGEGLAAAHAVGLVHRDFKPDNVMVGEDGRVRVMDFGLARRGAELMAPTSGEGGAAQRSTLLTLDMTQAGAIVGTPAYMAPEQFASAEVGPPADVFAFCVTFWEALYGQRPFGGESIGELRSNVFAGRRTPPRKRAPRWLHRILVRGLAVSPEERWSDLRELLLAISRGRAKTRQRRVGLVALGAVAVVLGGLAVQELRERRALADCAAQGAAIAEDWDPQARDDLREAFTATGRPAAGSIADKTLPWLDQWASAWTEAATEACVAEAVEGRWGPDMRARADQCLGEARSAFSALVHELQAANSITLVRATAAAAALTPSDVCLDPIRLAERPQSSSAEHDAILHVRLSRAASLRWAGDFAGGLEVANAALEAARAANSPAQVTESLLQRAALEAELGHYAAAEASLGQALVAAREARANRAAVAIMAQLISIVGERQARFAEGKVWAEAARTQLALLSTDERLSEAMIDSNLAQVLYAEGKFSDAAEIQERALDARIAALGESHPLVAESLSNLGVTRGTMAEHESALDLHRRALALRERALGVEHPAVATSLSELGVQLRELRRFDEAVVILERALSIREASLTPGHPDIVKALNNLASVRTVRLERDEALRLYLRAKSLLLADPAGDRRMLAKILYNVGLIQLYKRDFEGARESNERAAEIFEEVLGPAHMNLAYALEGLADALTGLGRVDETLPLWARALEIRRAALGPDNPEVGRCLSRFANLQRKRGAFDEALALDARAVEIFEASAHPFQVVALVGLGETLLALGRPAEAISQIERALSLQAERAEDGRTASTRFALARALWEVPKSRPQALLLAERAREFYAARGGEGEEVEELTAWIDAHGPRGR